jgi:hypothetical protein
MGESSAGVPEGEDLSISLAQANVRTLAISLPLAGLMLAAYLALAPQRPGMMGMSLGGGLLFLVMMIAGIVVHEAIHGLSWAALGRLPLKRIRFGFHAATLTPYAHALDPMSARAYRLGALMPALVLGVVPFAVGTALGSLVIALYGMVFVFAAGGDLLVLWLLRGVDPRARVLDHPSRAGCIILPAPPG